MAAAAEAGEAGAAGEGAATRRWRAGGKQIIPRPDGWTVGSDPAWLGTQRRFTVDQIEDALRAHGPSRRAEVDFADVRASAVLVALIDGADGAEVLLTRRSWYLRNHSGEVSFPGGRMDPGETHAETALRESFEEVRLDPAAVTVIGELDHLSTFVSNSYIVPVVARLPSLPDLTASADEVERIFYVSLSELIRRDTYRQERWGGSNFLRRINFFELDDETVWGATARILVSLLDIVWET